MKTINPSASLRINGERSRTVKFYTLGCKVNQYETQSMRESFIRAGLKECLNGKPADIYLINTCTVTHRADSESFNLIRKAGRENLKAKIIVTGCLTELDEDKIKGVYDKAIIVKNKEKENILNAFFLQNSRTHELANSRTKELKNSRTKTGISYFKGHTRAFLKIQDGCDNFCSYCKVPLVRGRSRSKKLAQVAKEAKALAKNGFKEIVLCGVCLGAYGKDLKPKLSLPDLIKELEKIEGLLRIRLSSIEAGDVSDELIRHMANSKKLCPHLHIPIQSGDDGILKKMNRGYSAKEYLRLVKKIRQSIPHIAITTDIIVGFPGESEKNFLNTMNLVKKIKPLGAHIFPYSLRDATLASGFSGRVSPATAKKRLRCLKDLAAGCSLAYRRRFLGGKMPLLIEGRCRENPQFWQGHTPNFLKVLLKTEKRFQDKIVMVKLSRIEKDYTFADLA